MAKYQIGIVGFGKIARDQHAPAIAKSDSFELAAVSNLGAGEPPPGVPTFKNVTEMLKSLPDLHAVALCTPPGPRRLIAIQCLDAGKDVLLEKPPAATVAEVSDIAAHASAAGKIVFATYHAQHNEAVKKAAAFLENKTVSRLLVTWKEDIRKWHPGQDWILSEGAFGIFDIGINALSILTHILPQALFIQAADLFFPANCQAPIAADLTFALGAAAGDAFKANLDWRWNSAEVWEIDIATDDGLDLKLAGGGCSLEMTNEAPCGGPDDEYPGIYREFAELISRRQSNADIAPFQLVADAFMIGRRTEVAPFAF